MRTWDDNRSVINDFWPTEWNPEEWKLIHDDLSPLDQSMLYDAIRNTKRKHDTPFVHLKWLLDEYRDLESSKKHALKAPRPRDEKLQLNIDDAHDRNLCDQFVAYIDECEPQHFSEVESRVLDKLPEMHAASAVRILNYARCRLLGEEQMFSRVTRSGDLVPIATGGMR